jgi:ribosomal protein S18 acetylase RimI-like enzyme
MHVTRHSDPETFLAAAQPVMARSAAAAAAFRSWTMVPPRADTDDGDVYLATASSGGAHGAALRRGGGPLVLEGSDPAAAAAIARDFVAVAPDLGAVVGGLAACEAFVRAWRERTGRTAVLRFRLRHHVLTAVADVPAAAGAARTAVDGDLDWLIDAQLAFVAEARVPTTTEWVRATVPRRLARGFYRIWDDDGRVAYAGWSDAGPDAARIAPVYTPPAARRRGYATALVAALCRELLARGKRELFLVTDLANPTSNAIYARIGFAPAGDLYHFDFAAPG